MQRIVNAREKELYNVKLANVVEAISSTIWFLIPYLVSTIFILWIDTKGWRERKEKLLYLRNHKSIFTYFTPF